MCIFTLAGLFAQTDAHSNSNENPSDVQDIQKEPEFPGGIQELYRYLNRTVIYPEQAKENGTEGHVIVAFIVEKDGSISNVNIVCEIGDGCGASAKRAIERMPKWSPGEANGHPVRVWYTIPYRFFLTFEGDDRKAPALPGRLPKRGSKAQIWTAVQNAISLTYGTATPVDQNYPILQNDKNRSALIEMLENSFRIKSSEADSAMLKTAGAVSAYFHRAQYAPIVYAENGLHGAFFKYPSSRPNFDIKKEGLEKIGSLRVPKGVKMVLYNKPNFEGKQLEINALNEAIFISTLSRLNFEKDRISTNSKSWIDWSVQTKSIQITFSEDFPWIN